MERARSTYDVTAFLTASTSVQEFSKVFEGLSALGRQGRVRLRIASSHERSTPRVLLLDVRNRDGAERSIAIDIADDVQILDPASLERVHAYFKRSLCAETRLSREQAPKVRPFGMNNPAIRPRTALSVLRARLGTGRNLRELGVDARQLFALPAPQSFERSPDEPAEPLVLFQTRLWEPRPTDPGAEAINAERVALVRTLRAAFGDRFLGGVIPTPFARAHFPDVITSLPFAMRAYPRLLRRPLVAVYSRGLLDSLAFKMSEYLAASRCIVAQPPKTTLPASLIAGRNFLPFETPDDCVARCEELLSRPDAAAAMRRSNWDYYQNSVEPSAHLGSILEQAFRD